MKSRHRDITPCSFLYSWRVGDISAKGHLVISLRALRRAWNITLKETSKCEGVDASMHGDEEDHGIGDGE